MKSKKITLYTDISGNTIQIKTYTYGTGKPGLYIQGGVHGGEVTYFIFHALHKFLRKNEKLLKKQVLLAPLINPTAWNQRIYYYTVGKFDLYKGGDWNRSYPGKETTLSDRNSHILFNLAKQHEFAIDLHTARHSKPYTLFADSGLSAYITSLGLTYNFFTPSRNAKYNGAFHTELAAIGKKALTIESGSHDSYDAETIVAVTSAIKRLLAQLDIIEEKKRENASSSIFVFEKMQTIFSPSSGFVQYLVHPQQQVKQNDILCKIYASDVLGKIFTIKAPFDGVVFELPKTHILWTGDELFKLIAQKDYSLLR